MRRNLFLLIIGFFGLAILLGLGFWQVYRLNWKQAIIHEIDARVAADPVALPAAPDLDADRYLAVAVSGVLAGDELHVLVSRPGVGAGYRIISAFETGAGRRVLVDRGFTPTSRKNAERVTGAMSITGNLHWPDETDAFTPEPDLGGNIWFARDVVAMARVLGSEPVMIIAGSPTDPGVTPWPVESATIRNDHLQYALTWFLLALVWSGMTLYFLWRTRTGSESNKT